MFRFLSKSLVQIRTRGSARSYCLQKQTSPSPDHAAKFCFTVDYLMNSCGLSEEAAQFKAKRFLLKGPDNPNSVIVFLTKHGFDKAHITRIVSLYPSLLSHNADRIIKPKIQYFLEVGLSLSQVRQLIVEKPDILRCSLTNHIKPTTSFFKERIGGVGSIVALISHLSWVLTHRGIKVVRENISLLESECLPHSSIAVMLIWYPRVIAQSPVRLKGTIMNIKEMGFVTGTPSLFVDALCTLYSSNTKLRSKVTLYKSFGMSEVDIGSAFLKLPKFMRLSEGKIRRMMDFYVNKLKLKPSDVSFSPLLLMFSFERRTIPRCTVLQILASNSKLQKDLNRSIVMKTLKMSEERFLEKYVTVHQDEIPDVLAAYQGTIDISRLNVGS